MNAHSAPYRAGRWWVIADEDLMSLLSRAFGGEEPVDIYLDLVASTARASGDGISAGGSGTAGDVT